jgi:uncharacterized protein YdaU (DUF1376 family)
MAKDPAFLFYSADFMVGTNTFTDAQTGKYIRLLCQQHQKGHLSEKDMLKICKVKDEEVFEKFIQDENGLYYNRRLDEEIQKRNSHCEKQRENILKRWGKEPDTKPIPKQYDGITMVIPLENENENINNSLNKGECEGEKQTELEKAIKDFKQHRKKIGKPMTDRAFTLFMNNLDKLGKTDEEKIAVINQSIMNGWTGIFPLSEQKTRAPAKNNAESLKYIQREYAPGELESLYHKFEPEDGSG